jgi:hypothetical protein
MRARQLVRNPSIRNFASVKHEGLTVIPGFLPDPLSLSSGVEAQTLNSQGHLVRAVEYVRSMHGGSHAHLMRCSDGFYYVVKFQDNPQHDKVLANELLGTSLAALLGLPATPFAIVEVGEELIPMTEQFYRGKGAPYSPCHAGLQYGSRFVGDPISMTTFDFLPDEVLAGLENLQDFLGMLVFDKWTCNTDNRQAMFHRMRGHTHFRVTMIDQGYCFNGGEWDFPDAPLRGIYLRQCVYAPVKYLASFDPWLVRLEHRMTLEKIEKAASEIPPEWYDFNRDALHHLLDWLDRRRMHVREQIEEAMKCARQVFPSCVQPYVQKTPFSH